MITWDVRSVLSSEVETEVSLAILEDPVVEPAHFLYWDEAVKIASDLFDHTNDDYIPPTPPGGGGLDRRLLTRVPLIQIYPAIQIMI